MKLILLLAAIYSLIFFQQYKISRSNGKTASGNRDLSQPLQAGGHSLLHAALPASYYFFYKAYDLVSRQDYQKVAHAK